MAEQRPEAWQIYELMSALGVAQQEVTQTFTQSVLHQLQNTHCNHAKLATFLRGMDKVSPEAKLFLMLMIRMAWQDWEHVSYRLSDHQFEAPGPMTNPPPAVGKRFASLLQGLNTFRTPFQFTLDGLHHKFSFVAKREEFTFSLTSVT